MLVLVRLRSQKPYGDLYIDYLSPEYTGKYLVEKTLRIDYSGFIETIYGVFNTPDIYGKFKSRIQCKILGRNSPKVT